MDVDNRFLRCVAEHRASLQVLKSPSPNLENRFCRLVAEERGRTASSAEPPTHFPSSPNVPAPPTNPTTQTIPTPVRIYYSTKTETPKPTESFLEKYKRTMDQRKAVQESQQSQQQSQQSQPPQQQSQPPQQPRHRQLSIESEESFPSLPSLGSASPVLGPIKGWSEALRKNLVEDGRLQKPKPRVRSEIADTEEGDQEIVFDADGFPMLVPKLS